MTSRSDAAALDPAAGARWELDRQFRGFFAKLRWGIRLLVLGAIVFVVAQMASVYRLFHDIHPWVGVAAVVAFGGLLAWLVGRPIYGALRVPRAILPPTLAPRDERTMEDWHRQVRYIERYLESLLRNPELVEHRGRIAEAQRELGHLTGEGRDLKDWGEALTAFEREHVIPVLAELDARVEALIHREALAVGSMTAVSPAGTLDVFLVLWRNVNLVATIARLYYGRPGLRGTFLILRDVSSAILLASVMEQLSDMSASMVRKVSEGSRAIPFVGAVVGPLLDGLVNALMTMKLGYLAKERCRSFQAWDGRSTPPIVAHTFKVVQKAGAGLFDELVAMVGRPLGRVRATADAGRETMQDISSRTIDFLKGIRGAMGRGRHPDVAPDPSAGSPGSAGSAGSAGEDPDR